MNEIRMPRRNGEVVQKHCVVNDLLLLLFRNVFLFLFLFLLPVGLVELSESRGRVGVLGEPFDQPFNVGTTEALLGEEGEAKMSEVFLDERAFHIGGEVRNGVVYFQLFRRIAAKGMKRILVGKVRITKKVLDEQLREPLVGGRRSLDVDKGREKALALGKEMIVNGHLEGLEVQGCEETRSPVPLQFFRGVCQKYFSM